MNDDMDYEPYQFVEEDLPEATQPSGSSQPFSLSQPKPPPLAPTRTPWLVLIPRYHPENHPYHDPKVPEIPTVEVYPPDEYWAVGRFPPRVINPVNYAMCKPNSTVINHGKISNFHAIIEVIETGHEAEDVGAAEGSSSSAKGDREGKEHKGTMAPPTGLLPSKVGRGSVTGGQYPSVEGSGGPVGGTSKWAQVAMKDMSTNGTFVNRRLIEKGKWQFLRSGDEIHLAKWDNKNDDLIFPRPEFHWVVQLPFQNQALQQPPHPIWSRYETLIMLGAGTFAKVFKVFDMHDRTMKAMKLIDKLKHGTDKREHNLTNFRRELEILKIVNHPNIVQFYDNYEDDRYIYIIQELIEGGEYLDYITSTSGVDENNARTITAMLVQAVAYLTALNIAHRDLKPENIMMTGGINPVPKIVDFGLAKHLIDSQEIFETQCGTPAYLAPEVVLDELRDNRLGHRPSYSTAVDIYSLGVITYAALMNAMPWEMAEKPNIREQVRRREIDISPLAGVVSYEAQDFIVRALQKDPNLRMTAMEALNHPWIRPRLLSYPCASDLPENQSQDSSQGSGTHRGGGGDADCSTGQGDGSNKTDCTTTGRATGSSSAFGSLKELPAEIDTGVVASGARGGGGAESIGVHQKEAASHRGAGHTDDMESDAGANTTIGSKDGENDDREQEDDFFQDMRKMRLLTPNPATSSRNTVAMAEMNLEDNAASIVDPSAPPSQGEGSVPPPGSRYSLESKKRLRQWSSSANVINGCEDRQQPVTTVPAPAPATEGEARPRASSAPPSPGTSGAPTPATPTPSAEVGSPTPSVVGCQQGETAPRRSSRIATVAESGTIKKVTASRRKTAAMTKEISESTRTPRSPGVGSSRPRKTPRKA